MYKLVSKDGTKSIRKEQEFPKKRDEELEEFLDHELHAEARDWSKGLSWRRER
jgi:hypothetical protein